MGAEALEYLVMRSGQLTSAGDQGQMKLLHCLQIIVTELCLEHAQHEGDLDVMTLVS
jgi:hypothetical protein